MTGFVPMAAGPWRADLAPERGGRMARLRFGESDVLEPITNWDPPGRAWPGAGLYPLAPYSNRIENGLLQAGEREVQLAVHAFAKPHALHGPAHRRPWMLEAADPDEVSLRLDYEADEDWPWAFEARLVYAFRDDACVTTLSLRNRAAEPMPAGLGLHPFFHAPSGSLYTFAYRDRWQQLETDPPSPQFGEDATEVREVAAGEGLAACLGRWSGEATIERPDLTIRMTASPNLAHLVLYRAAGSSFLCLEPVSHVTNGFNLHAAGQPYTGATFLGPDETLDAAMTIHCAGPAASGRP